MFAAPLSHVFLDFLVGVHKNPILWPFSDKLYSLNHGILPSAGRLSFGNYYFWRNLVVELGILIPMIAVISPTVRVLVGRSGFFVSITILIFFSCVFFSYCLQR